MDKIWQAKCPSFKPLELSCGHNPGNNNWNIQASNSEGVGNRQVWKVLDGTCHKSVLSLDSGQYMNRYHSWGAVSLLDPLLNSVPKIFGISVKAVSQSIWRNHESNGSSKLLILEPLRSSSVTSNGPGGGGHGATSPAMGAIPVSAVLLLPKHGILLLTAWSAPRASQAQFRQRWH